MTREWTLSGPFRTDSAGRSEAHAHTSRRDTGGLSKSRQSMHWRVVLLLPLFLPILLLPWPSFVFLPRACLYLVSYPPPPLTAHVCLFLLSTRPPYFPVTSITIYTTSSLRLFFFSFLIKRDPLQSPPCPPPPSIVGPRACLKAGCVFTLDRLPSLGLLRVSFLNPLARRAQNFHRIAREFDVSSFAPVLCVYRSACGLMHVPL